MENNANEAHIFWKSQDQQTEVWMKQVSGKTPEEKKEQSRSGYCLLAEMIKTRYAYDLEKETDSVMRTETGNHICVCIRNFFSISAIRENGSPVCWEMSLWGLISSITEK